MFEPQKLFVYGTLKNTDRISALVGRIPSDPFRTTLKGYRSYDTGYGYPVALPEEDAEIKGILWAALPMDAIERLDAYEGGLGLMYDRIEVEVTLDTGDVEAAWFYVGVSSHWKNRELRRID